MLAKSTVDTPLADGYDTRQVPDDDSLPSRERFLLDTGDPPSEASKDVRINRQGCRVAYSARSTSTHDFKEGLLRLLMC